MRVCDLHLSGGHKPVAARTEWLRHVSKHKASVTVLVAWAVASIAVVFAETGVIGAVAWVALLIGAAAAGLLLRSVLADVVAGTLLHREKPFGFGDRVAVGNISGRVVKIGRVTTAILTRNGLSRVRNSALVESASAWPPGRSPLQKLELTLVVRVPAEPENVRRLLLKISGQNTGVMRCPLPAVYFDAIGTDVLRFALVVFIAPNDDELAAVGAELAAAISAEFAEAGIDAMVHFESSNLFRRKHTVHRHI